MYGLHTEVAKIYWEAKENKTEDRRNGGA